MGSRVYCVTDIYPEHRKLSQLEAVVRFLTRRDPALKCECLSGPEARDSVGTVGWAAGSGVGRGAPFADLTMA